MDDVERLWRVLYFNLLPDADPHEAARQATARIRELVNSRAEFERAVVLAGGSA